MKLTTKEKLAEILYNKRVPYVDYYRGKGKMKYFYVEKTATFCNKCAGCAEAKNCLFGFEADNSRLVCVPIPHILDALYRIRKDEQDEPNFYGSMLSHDLKDSNAELAELLGFCTEPEDATYYLLLVIQKLLGFRTEPEQNLRGVCSC